MEVYYGNNIPEHLQLDPIKAADAMGFSLWPDSPNWLFQFLRQIAHNYIFGVKTLAEAAEKVKLFTLQGVADKIQCPTLYVVGEADFAFLHSPNDSYVSNDDHSEHAKRAYAGIPHHNKKMIIFRIGKPGAAHCSCDSSAFAAEEICDWFDVTLRNR